MPANYVLLERTELNASAASVTFANIPQTGYTDLKIVLSTRTTDTTANDSTAIALQFNGDTASNYSRRSLVGDGGSATSTNATTTSMRIGFTTTNGCTANTFGNGEFYVPNYTGSTQKSVSADAVAENNSATFIYSALNAGLWTGTAAITSITILTPSFSFLANSTFSLYGLAALGTTPAVAPKASGGNIIDYDGTYWIHTFNTSGTFTPQTGLTCDYLVVAGGGGGSAFGSVAGAGGGAGGLRSTVTATGGGGSLESALSLTAQAYTVTVGAGGANGVAGSNSVFSTITSTGGGNGGVNAVGATGGSGGGASSSSGTKAGGAGTANQGFAGGSGTPNSGGVGGVGTGGGGGAGAVGANNNVALFQGGAGGAGVAVAISGSSVTYAGGGGGCGDNREPSPTNGAGGSGGGGAGNFSGTGNAGGTNTGGGGGGSSSTGGAGGSGIVIIRYLAV
jgi:hypothetical protein